MTPALPNLLIIDDDVALRTAFARALERIGYGVVATTGSPEVLDLISNHQPAMILCDNHMPGASGVELITLIRRQWSAEELPIVLISGSSIQGEIDAAMQAGANDFRRKPVDLADLVAAVECAIASPGPLRPVGDRS